MLLALAGAATSAPGESELHGVELFSFSTVPAAGTAVPAPSFSSPRGLRFPPEGGSGYGGAAVPSAGAVEAGSGSKRRGSVPPSEDSMASAMTPFFVLMQARPLRY